MKALGEMRRARCRKAARRILAPTRVRIKLALGIVVVAFIMVQYVRTHTQKFVHFAYDWRDQSGANLTSRPTKYRMNDMLVCARCRWGSEGQQVYLLHFPKSIVSTYMQRTSEMERWDILSQIIDERASWAGIDEFVKPCVNPIDSANALTRGSEQKGRGKDDMLVVHLRLGDVLESPGLMFSHYIALPGWYKWYQLPRNINHVVFIGNPYHGVSPGKHPVKSLAYLNLVADMFRQKLPHGCVDLRIASFESTKDPQTIAETADRDLVFLMTRASRIVTSGGGFSGLISKIAGLRGIPVDWSINASDANERMLAFCRDQDLLRLNVTGVMCSASLIDMLSKKVLARTQQHPG